MSLRQRYRGARVLVTGVTGFVGEGLLERLLGDLAESRVMVLIRPKEGSDGQARLRQLLTKPAFRALVSATPADLLADRVEVLEGDLEHLPALPGDLDLVVHCAGEVSFDPPIDEGFETNLHGTRRLLEAIAASGSRPHYVHVSTAYVAGLRKGPVSEGPHDHQVDWRAEAAAAARTRQAVEDSSRRPAALARCIREATKVHGRAGPQAVAADADRRRVDWVDHQLRQAGAERARSLGWTDCYTFTKALGERVVEQAARGQGLPVSIVRPSIIESALSRPYPGWIEGFKMAEPIILAYGRGELPEFPAVPDGPIDIVPVDLVVAALLAVGASPPPPGQPAYYHLCSSGRNPLAFRGLYDLVRSYYQAHPFTEADRGAVRVPTWRFPGPRRVEGMLRGGERANAVADSVVSRLPRSPRVLASARGLDRQRRRLEFLRRYADLYRAYSEAELEFVDDNTLALHRGLSAPDRADFDFDVARIDWHHYLVEVHCPAVSEPMRALLAGRRARRPAGRPADGLPVGNGRLAIFDMDGTLLSSNVVESYLWLRLGELDTVARAREVVDLAARLPGYLLAERRDRGAFLRAVYRRYAGTSLAELRRLVDEQVSDTVLARLCPAAVRRVREHRAAGHRTVLVTGAIEPLTRPLAPLFDEIVAAELDVREGRCTGYLAAPPLVGETRAAWLRHYAGTLGADLTESYAYADSQSDLPMLRAVGNPVAVNPDVALSRVARTGRWPVEDWA